MFVLKISGIQKQKCPLDVLYNYIGGDGTYYTFSTYSISTWVWLNPKVGQSCAVAFNFKEGTPK